MKFYNVFGELNPTNYLLYFEIKDNKIIEYRASGDIYTCEYSEEYKAALINMMEKQYLDIIKNRKTSYFYTIESMVILNESKTKHFYISSAAFIILAGTSLFVDVNFGIEFVATLIPLIISGTLYENFKNYRDFKKYLEEVQLIEYFNKYEYVIKNIINKVYDDSEITKCPLLEEYDKLVRTFDESSSLKKLDINTVTTILSIDDLNKIVLFLEENHPKIFDDVFDLNNGAQRKRK